MFALMASPPISVPPQSSPVLRFIMYGSAIDDAKRIAWSVMATTIGRPIG
jgi:hypothetical protein